MRGQFLHANLYLYAVGSSYGLPGQGAPRQSGLQRGAECSAPAARRHGYCVRAGIRVGKSR